MSVIVSNCNEINGNPLNSSTAKFLYSFSKDERFKTIKGNPNKLNAYDLGSKLTKKGSKFGTAPRKDWTIKNEFIPAPNTYEISSVFDSNKSSLH